MISCARIFVVALAFAAGSVSAVADDELLKTQPFPEQQPQPTPPAPGARPQTPPPEARRQAPPPTASSPGVAQQGDPGMMGMPWPKTPEEASKTLNNLYAFLATTDDHRLGGEISGAIERLWRLSGGDTVNLLIDRAELFSSRNESAKALPLLDAAVDLAPDYAEAWSHRGYIEYRLNNYPAALGDLRRALALDPNHFRALDGMAKILTLMGEKKAALEAYDQLLKIHPNIEGATTERDKLKEEVEGRGI